MSDTPRRGRPPKYDWDKYFDGQRHVLHKGRDFDTRVESFRALVHRTANTRIERGPWKAETKILDNNTVAFRFFHPE